MRGRWTSHPKYGKQFEVHSYTTVLPATVQGIQRYLGSGLIKGIGPVMAERMVGHFGVDIMHIIDDEPGRLIEVNGLGPKRTAMIAADSPERIKAGLADTLSEAADDGPCFLPAPNLIADAAKILEVPTELIAPCLDELTVAEGVIRESVPAAGQAAAAPQVPAVYLPPFFTAERSLASALLRLLAARGDRLAAFGNVDWDKALSWLRSRTGAPLAPEQEEAVRLALTSRVAVLTGGPGCGKSFTVRSVVALARARGAKVVLAAPTGREGSLRSTPHRRWTPTWWWWARPRWWM